MMPEALLLRPNRLLAKSVTGRWRGSYSLSGHTADVVQAVTILIDALGDRLVAQFDVGCSLAELKKTARLSAYLHDWGKANDHFQGIVRHAMPGACPQRHPLTHPQLVRHEIFSVLLAWEFREWLEQADGDLATAMAVAGGHHLKLGGKGGTSSGEFGEIRQGTGSSCLHFLLQHIDFKRLLQFGVKQLACPAKLKLSTQPPMAWTIARIKQQQQAVLAFFAGWEPNPVLVAVLKALLVAGDSLGSAIAPTDLKLDTWVATALGCTLAKDDLERVIQSRLQGYPPRLFQKQLGEIGSRVALARAGCGTGKTIGAYCWAKRHAVGRKLFFCYPTTGTSTEGFLDYVQDEVPSVLLHSRAAVDLELARTGEEEEAGDGTDNEAAIKLQSFAAWESQAIVCTVDTVLGLLQCHRRPMYCFPAIANAAFVFDEVHCYDSALFGALLRFLETIKAPILLMSASFLPSQVRAIEQAVGEPLAMISGPKDIEQQERYSLRLVAMPSWERVIAELQAGGKVLWVCNQVSTAVAVYEEAKRRRLNARLYHSRFRYEDRVRHHRAVVDAFKPGCPEPVLAIATQVAEMSLDLSATLLVSQIADPAALVQRLGRLNRRYCGRPLDALFYPDPKQNPYSQGQRDRGLAMVTAFSGAVCQAQLAAWLEQEETPFLPKHHAVLLDGAWRTYPAPLREGGVTVTCLLEQDRPMLERAASSQLNRYTLPLLANTKRIQSWSRCQGFPVAPTNEFRYCPEIGAIDLKVGSGGDRP